MNYAEWTAEVEKRGGQWHTGRDRLQALSPSGKLMGEFRYDGTSYIDNLPAPNDDFLSIKGGDNFLARSTKSNLGNLQFMIQVGLPVSSGIAVIVAPIMFICGAMTLIEALTGLFIGLAGLSAWFLGGKLIRKVSASLEDYTPATGNHQKWLE